MNKSVHQDYFNLNQINLELLTQKKKYKELFENLSKEYIKKEENNKFLASQLRKIVKNSDESDNLNDFPAFFLNEIKLIEGIPLHYPNEELILRECFDVMEETSSLLKNFSLTLAIRLEKTLKKIKIFFEKQKSDLVGIYSILDILKINALKKSISEKILKNPNILEEIKVSIDNYQKSEHREILNEMENNNLNFQLKIFEKDNQLLKLQIKELKEKNDKLNEQCMDLIAKNKNFSKEKSILRDQNEDFSQKASEYWKRFQEIHNLIQVLGCNFKLIQNNNFENPITETNIYKELFLNEKLKVYDLQKQSEENARNVSDLNTFSFNFESKFTNLVVGDGEDKQYHNIKSELQLKSCSEKNFKQNSVQDTLEEERKEGILRYELPSHYAFIQKEIVENLQKESLPREKPLGEDLKEEEKNKEELEKIKKLLSDIKIDSELLETKQTKRKKVKHQELFQESSEIIKNVIFSDYSDENREIPKKEKKQINLENNELNSLKKSLKEKISILQEKNKLKINKLNDILKKKKKGLASISTMKPLKIFANEFKNSNIILELENSIPTYRQLKGDGNCFFRAAGFLFLESLFVEGMNPESGEMSPTKLNQFLEMLEKKNLELIDFKTETIDKDLIEIFQKEKNLLIEILELNLSEIFLKKLENIEINQFESNLGAIKDLEDKINENLAFDMSIICMIRSMIFSTCLLQKIDCSNHIETLHTYGREAEYQIVPFIIQILNLRINVYKLDFDDVKKKENLSVQKYGRIDDFKIKLVNFFFRPGHYEIGYDKEFLKEAYNLEF